MKPNKPKPAKKSVTPVKSAPSQKDSNAPSFFRFIFYNKTNLQFLIAGVVIGITYAIVLGWLFPRPSFYIDSGTYIQAARDHAVVSFRPLGYSDFLNFFHDIYISSTFLVMTQFACNIVANLFLFFTFQYFFPLSRWYRLALFVLLICNPLYLFYSNYVLSEAFFCSFTIVWLCVLLWLIQRPNWINFFAQVILLGLLFKLRYNALIYPFFTAAAFYLSRQAVWKKAAGIILSIAVIAAIVDSISSKTEKVTDTRVFSAFGGWQMASNALNILKYTEMDTTSFSSAESKEIYILSRKFFDSLAKTPPDTSHAIEEVTASYMWDPHAPLKAYLPYFAQKRFIPVYFKAWNALGPVFSSFGVEVIVKNPIQFIRYFVWPNAKLYWWPPMEAYNGYNNNKKTVDKVVKEYYRYPDDKVDLSHGYISNNVLRPWKYLFPILNAIFLLLVSTYFIMRVYKRTTLFFTTTLLFLIVFYVFNFGFAVAVSPTVFRYHVGIITICVILCTYLTQYVFSRENTSAVIKGTSA